MALPSRNSVSIEEEREVFIFSEAATELDTYSSN